MPSPRRKPCSLKSSNFALTLSAVFLCAVAFGLEVDAQGASPTPGGVPNGATILRLLGPHAQAAFAPARSPGMGALVRLPPGIRASDWGLREFAPGIARLWGSPEVLLSFAAAHGEAALEVAPPLHLLLDTAAQFVTAPAAAASGFDGTGVTIGIADTGLDVTHPDFLDSQGHTRVAWLLDLSVAPLGKHSDLEKTFGSTDSAGKVVFGAVWSAADIDAAMQAGGAALPQDEVGHGTLVTSCAAGNGGSGTSKFLGIAPRATIVAARITAAGDESIGNDELLRGVAFLFDRGAALNQPVVVNLSIGSDFGPHDGTLAWEQTLASYVGPSHPGRAIVAAAGNSGSISETPIHQNVHVSSGTAMRVPIVTGGAQNGGIQVWVAMHSGAALEVGLDAPTETWIAPVHDGQSAGKNTGAYSAGVYNGSASSGSPVPAASHGAVVVWQGAWPAGTYAIALTGTGTADLYLEASGDAATASPGNVGFAYGVRQSTINLPATHPDIIGVGCTINKPAWMSIASSKYGLALPLLDTFGGLQDPSQLTRDPESGEPCWFSSAGPTLTGIQKPEIMAPGAAIIGALSRQAVPPASASIFSTMCVSSTGTSDPTCEEIDHEHGVSAGTSFSSPLVAGAVALLFQHDPTLTQGDVLAALQAGAHKLRASSLFDDQAGVGELDIVGALAAADRLRMPELVLPSRDGSWLTMGAEQFLADGSTPLEAVLALRGSPDAGSLPADGFEASRLSAYASVDGAQVSGATHAPVRRGPGIWVVTVNLPSGLGGARLTVGATFDGQDIAAPKTIPIATDIWNGDYPPSLKGGCSASSVPNDPRQTGSPWLALAAMGMACAFRRSRATVACSASLSSRRCPQ